MSPSQSSYAPAKGMVPDEKTAILIAEAVLVPIYGEKEVKEQAPWSVNLKKGIWVLKGRLKARLLGRLGDPLFYNVLLLGASEKDM